MSKISFGSGKTNIIAKALFGTVIQRIHILNTHTFIGTNEKLSTSSPSSLQRTNLNRTFFASSVGRALCQTLDDASPDSFKPDSLAMSLRNLANILSDLDCREETLEAAAKDAVAFYRTALAEARPDALTLKLAASLDDLAKMLSNRGRREEALEASEEAVALYGTLTEARSDG